MKRIYSLVREVLINTSVDFIQVYMKRQNRFSCARCVVLHEVGKISMMKGTGLIMMALSK